MRRGKGPESDCDDGFLHFEFKYLVHRVPSVDNASLYPCLWANWKEPCPICDWMRANQQVQPEQLLKDMRVYTRHLWNAIDLNTKDQRMQVLDTNHYNRGAGFGEQIKKALSAVPRYADFARYDRGSSLALTIEDLSMGGGRKYKACTRIDFLPQEKPWGKGILKECCQLESCLIHYEYDQLRDMFLQQGMPTPRKTETSAPTRREAPQDSNGRYRESRREAEPPRREAPPPDTRREDPPPDTRREPPPQQPPASAPPPKKEPTAQEYGIKLSDNVRHPKFGVLRGGSDERGRDEPHHRGQRWAGAPCRVAR